MIHNKRQKSVVMFLATVLIVILGLRFSVATLNAEIIADKSYAIAVDGENIDLDGTNNVVVYLKYTNSGEINASNINLTFQLDGSTENLLEASAYTWDVEYHDAVMQSMFLERPLAEPSYTHSFDITPNRDAQGNLIPSVKSATVRVYYAGTLLANKTFYVITPITMNGFVTGYDSINSKFILLKRVDDDTDIDNDNSNGQQRVDSLGREIETSVTLDISTTEDVVWYYRPRTSEDDNDWKEIKASDNFVDVSYDDVNSTVTFTAKEKSGGLTFVGRKKESGYYTETVEFDVLIAAYATPTDKKELIDMYYGKEVYYGKVVPYAGDLFVWYDRTVEGAMDVVMLDDDKNPTLKPSDATRKLTANYYGTVALEYSPVRQEQEDEYSTLYTNLKCIVDANVIFDIIKSVGNTGWTRVAPGGTEVLSVGSPITIMTNIRGSNEEVLDWAVSNDGGALYKTLEGYNNEVAATAISAGSYSAGYRLMAQKGSQLEISCSSTRLSEKREFTIIITDGLEIDPSAVSISVGDSVNIEVKTTNSKNPIYWDIVDSDGNSIIGDAETCIKFSTAPENKSIIRVTGLKAGIAYVTATQSVGNSTMTAKCKVTVTDSLEDVNIYGEIEEGKVTIPEGEVIELNVELWDAKGNPYVVTADDIKWVSLNEKVAKVEMDTYDPRLARITGVGVGKAYVAVVANDISQTQIDIVEVIVVAAPTGILISEHVVEDSIDNFSYRLTAEIQPPGAQELEIEWTSSDTNIATVNENGIVFYHKAGEVVITARVGEHTDTCIFRIITPIRDILLSEYEKVMMIGETLLLVATPMPIDATMKDVIWESSDTRVATVEESGLVTAVGAGTAFINCRAANGDVTVSCSITVYQQVTEIQLNYERLTVRKGAVLWLYAQVVPDTAINQEVIWTSSNPEVATVDEYGQITALKAGVTEITVTSVDTGASDTCVLTVSESVTGITLNVRHMTIEIGEKFVLIPTVRPVEAENKDVTWFSSDTNVAVVDQNGVVTGIRGGTTVIVCQTVDRGLIASCTITVNEYITELKFAEDEVYIPKGELKTLDVKVTPATATNKHFEWKSQDESILTVDSSGMVYGVDYGTVIVTVSTTDGSEKKATCKVHVIKPVDKITLSDTMIQVREGLTHQLTATIHPEDASIKKIIWTSSDTSIAKVNSFGVVTGVKEGVCTITATAADGCGAFEKCEVTVLKSILVTSITVNSQDTTMVVGDTKQITARMKPVNTTETYSWVSSDDSIAKVSKDGKVTAVGAGTATITAVTDTSGVEASFKVTVVALNTTKLTLEQYDTYNLYVDGVTSGVTWYSRNKRVATVTAGGMVVGRQAGTTTIVGRINGKRVVCEVTVTSVK
ncbi:MAG: hypothetical protein E7261_12280 [Lachnospiraceae bacterium]|nr:hypothetical protein [Lachnospiraceae bacterium]